MFVKGASIIFFILTKLWEKWIFMHSHTAVISAGMESVMEVITDVVLVLVSEIGWTGGIAFAEDDDKQKAQLVTGSHHSSLSKTLLPPHCHLPKGHVPDRLVKRWDM